MASSHYCIRASKTRLTVFHSLKFSKKISGFLQAKDQEEEERRKRREEEGKRANDFIGSLLVRFILKATG